MSVFSPLASAIAYVLAGAGSFIDSVLQVESNFRCLSSKVDSQAISLTSITMGTSPSLSGITSMIASFSISVK